MYQYVFYFRTPPYRDQNIQKERQCFIQLLRPSDNDVSEPHQFVYKPSNRVLHSDRKRVRIDSTYNSDEFLKALPTVITNMSLSNPEFNSNEYGSFANCESDITEMNSDEFKNFLKSVQEGKYISYCYYYNIKITFFIYTPFQIYVVLTHLIHKVNLSNKNVIIITRY